MGAVLIVPVLKLFQSLFGVIRNRYNIEAPVIIVPWIQSIEYHDGIFYTIVCPEFGGKRKKGIGTELIPTTVGARI